MPPPNFLFIVGAAKCGTSALASWLGAREDVVLGATKEPNYFTDFALRPWSGPAAEGLRRSLITDERAYFDNFAAKPAASWAIDASTDYLWSDGTAEGIKRFAARFPCKVIGIVRDPIERAVSEYNHTLRHDWEKESFETSLALEETRMARHWHPLFYHRRRSSFHGDLSRYAALFGPDMLVLDYAELREPNRLMERITAFLGVPPLPVSEIPRENVSLLPRSRLAKAAASNELLRRVARAILASEQRQKLWNFFHRPSSELKTTSKAEEKLLRTLMQDEIAACVSDPMVPTGSWKKALEP